MQNVAEIAARLAKVKIVPVVKIEDASLAVPMARALLAGGIDVIEITFRTECAAEAIKNIKEACPDALVGAGTVLSVANCDKALAAGADFVVAPGLNDVVVSHCIDIGCPIIPGVETPSDIERALNYGLTYLKFFPAEENGGLKKIKALGAPYSMVQFMPTGGITLENAKEYLAQKNVFCCGGSFVVRPEHLATGAFEKISEICLEIGKRL